jgi:hypothetical protein
VILHISRLILKHANASRSCGEWLDDDFDVLEAGVVVGRIFFSPVAPQDRPWMWASGHSADSVQRAAYGYAPTREGRDGGVREELAEGGVALGANKITPPAFVQVGRSPYQGRLAMSGVERSDRGNAMPCPRCGTRMNEVVRIEPKSGEPGLIAYECPNCICT